MAPPMAADALGRAAITGTELLAELVFPAGVDLALVETAGGVRSPMTEDLDCAGYANALRPDRVVLVADAGLGTINSIRLSMGTLTGLDTVVFLNRYDDADDLHCRNRRWLEGRDGYRVVVDVDGAARDLAVTPAS
jgi:dethiobiotin synthetase